MKNIDWENLAFEFQTTKISLTEMGKRENVDRRTLAKHFKALGIEIINKQNCSKFNEHIFDEIDSEEKSYWLGFIFADGYISSSPLREDVKSIYQFELSLGLKDQEHLEKFRVFMEYEKPLLVDTYRCRFAVASKHLWSTLNNYGCTPNKSLTLNFPNVPEHLIRHFIRGYFDGDGCISRHVHNTCVTPHIELLGTKQMLEHVLMYSGSKARYKHNIHHSKETWTLEWTKDLGIEFINYLYGNCSIYLNRKYELYQFFKNGSRSVKEFTELSSGNIGGTPEMGNTEIIEEIKESSTSYSVGNETFQWYKQNLLESGCYSCELPKDCNGNCLRPKNIGPCPNYSGFWKRI